MSVVLMQMDYSTSFPRSGGSVGMRVRGVRGFIP
jgi:hypothetical protein